MRTLLALLLALAACTPVEQAELQLIGDTLVPRATHTATLLPDGKVLIAGGCTAAGCGGSEQGRRAELFDPARAMFSAAASMTTPRLAHTATPLRDGRVLLVGGYAGEGTPPLASAELYDPRTATFTPTGSLTVGRSGHVAVPLRDGRVLVAGGRGANDDYLASAELYDPRRGTFTEAAPAGLRRDGGVGVPLPDGRVLVASGQSATNRLTAVAEVYDPAADRWEPASSLGTARRKVGASPLPGGAVLVVGGSIPQGDRDLTLRDAEVFDPRSRTFRATAPMHRPRYKIDGSVVALSDGSVLVAGGATVAELYADGRFRLVGGQFDSARSASTATRLNDGRVLVVGGYDERITPQAAAYVFTRRTT